MYNDDDYEHREKIEDIPIKASVDELLIQLKDAQPKGKKGFDAVKKLDVELQKHNGYLAANLSGITGYPGVARREYNKVLLKYTKQCEESIYKYQDKILAAPGNWNQFKAAVKGFFERRTKVKADSIEVKASGYNQDAVNAFQKAKDTIKQTKEHPDYEGPTPTGQPRLK